MARKAREFDEEVKVAEPEQAPPPPVQTDAKAEAKERVAKKRKARMEAPAPRVEKPTETKIAAPAGKAGGWRFIVFGDLHVKSTTLDRALRLLKQVGDLARIHDAGIVCTGDFWDQRASLSVRQLDAVLTCLQAWADQGTQVVMIPGNHDQVSLDGTIHAVRAFEPFANIAVATTPLIDPNSKLAFLPWRERAGEQAAMFDALDGDDWTIFAHAEVKGAKTNAHHEAAGRVSVESIEAHARACYLGHYHRRQKLGTRTWYLGSPFEMDFGEMGEPKGVALIDSNNVEPAFLDIDDFPKHVRAKWPEDRAKLAAARPIDIVEVQMSRAAMHSPELATALAETKAVDVRPIVRATEDTLASAVPTVALNVDAAITEWCRALEGKSDEDRERIATLARELMREVADKRAIAPLAPKVRITKVLIDNFCAVRGHAELSFVGESATGGPYPGLGPMLLRGRMGSGKTSICDAITWGLQGTTTPRKPGERGGTLKSDDVIHDSADETRVRVCLDLVPGPKGEPWAPVAVERTKKRGKTAEIRIYGPPFEGAEGIADSQDLVNRIIGLDLDLWRATVYLGQGAVANFVTDADKKRKDILARTFGLSTVEPALKVTRERSKRVTADRQNAELAVATQRAALDVMKGTDLTAQSETWEAQRQARLEGIVQGLHTEYARIQEIDPHLAHEAQWLDTKSKYEAHRDMLVKSLSGGSGADMQRQKLMGEMASAQAERAATVAKLQSARQTYAQLSDPNVHPVCRTCGQALDEERRAIQATELESEIPAREAEIGMYDARISNAFLALEGMKNSGSPQAEQVQAQLREANEVLEKCAQALNGITKLKANREASLKRYTDAQAEHTRLAAETNPFAAKVAETAAKIAETENLLAQAQQSAATLGALSNTLEDVEQMFSPKGLPVLVLRTVIYELETQANRFLGMMLGGKIHCAISLAEDDLDILWYEFDPVKRSHVERSFYQLSGGQRRCCELAFSPFALSEMIFARAGVRVPFLVVDELTTHLDVETKPLVCAMLRALDRDTIVVIDHDAGVSGEFDLTYDVTRTPEGNVSITRGT